MKLPTQNDSDRGQVGIGTLIIFIALVLVAAVAAGVLVTTAGDLQSRASDTGQDAQAQVSNQIDVVSATGEVNANDSIGTVSLVVKKSPGSDPIDLSEATIEYTSSGASETLSFSDTLGTNAFTTTAIDGGPTEVLENTDERIEITIDASSIETGDGLAEGGDAELRIVDQSGATTVYGVNVPDVLTGDYAQV
ncbi:flagellin A precursor [Halolamina pelagica]|uniref:Flagellin n=1 Tax=Halolamina pelagica TaxID=699431 RepID=A0A0P7GU60_9EURY|nr:flagellin [Halolamina pelagica]KPN29025.1 flagellin A precursor [Halolamina pelagica]